MPYKRPVNKQKKKKCKNHKSQERCEYTRRPVGRKEGRTKRKRIPRTRLKDNTGKATPQPLQMGEMHSCANPIQEGEEHA